MTARPRLSLCMIVRDERALLARCLASVGDLADEIVVVDTGSTDGSQDAALAAGARVIEQPWTRDFAHARNRSLSEATGRWILVLDADEQLTAPHRAALRELLDEHTPRTGDPAVAFNLVQNNVAADGRSGMLVRIIRLFPNRADVRYAWPVHEQVGDALRSAAVAVVDSDVEILHDGYADPARNLEKQRRNRAIFEHQLESHGSLPPMLHFLLAGAQLDLGDTESALASYRRCAALVPAGDAIGEASTVRIATCLVRLGRHDEALAAMGTGAATPSRHPELLVLRGHCERARGRADRAAEAYLTALDVNDRAFLPPCNLASVKLDAVGGFAALLLAQGRREVALRMLHGAVARHREGIATDRAWLASVLPIG